MQWESRFQALSISNELPIHLKQKYTENVIPTFILEEEVERRASHVCEGGYEFRCGVTKITQIIFLM